MFAFKPLPRQTALIFALLLTNSMCVSSLIPMMGLFIVEGLGQEPWQIGLYTGLVLPLTMLANRWSGERLDHGMAVRKLLLISVSAYLLLTAILTQTADFYVLLGAVAPLMSLANMGSGTIFTFGRLHAEQNNLDIAKINSWLRMAVSLAWMIGPAAAFSLSAIFGFSTAFTASFVLGVCYLLLWNFVVPAEFKAPPRPENNTRKEPMNWGLLIASTICLGFVITNSLFMAAMPLYFIQDTGLPGSTPGLAFSVKCLIEVFVIFGSVRLAQRIGTRPVLFLAALLAALSMILFSYATSVWQVLAIAALEGTYYGLFAGLAITFVQSFAPDRPGRATAVYMNSLFFGGFIGSVSMGFIASATSFQMVLYVAAAASLVSMIVLLATARVQPTSQAKQV
ncbi:MFS transporter [Roseibium sp.]|uniref:MFS transporter n=1 Tax=Roseibium sp. TaxID=1936156 RepID=UPI003D0A80FE